MLLTTLSVVAASALLDIASTNCSCSPFSGNMGGCCSGAMKDECSSAFSHHSCNSSTPVCCASDFSTTCCSAGSACSGGCRNTLEGSCHCKTQPTSAAVGYNATAALHVLGFSAAAQCSSEAILAWNCTACPAASPLESINVTRADGHLAYVGYDAPLQRIQVVLRGSLSIQDWLNNLDFLKEEAYGAAGCTDCRVHRGFLGAFRSLQPGIEASVDALLLRYPHAKVAITGHSLGAAMATHAAIALGLVKGLDLDPVVYTFGQPRVGDPKFAAWFAARFGSWFRVVHWNDPVPHVPPADFGFQHVGREVWYDSPSDARIICADGTHGEDRDCSDSVAVALAVDDHFTYLGHPVVQCRPFGLV
jgi:pimeloyl-ACP methyl ester carboxylesterase